MSRRRCRPGARSRGLSRPCAHCATGLCWTQGVPMPLVHLVLALALAEFFFFGLAVARARATYNVPAPAMSGHEVFERYFRVQMNTLEHLVIFVPGLLLFASYVSPW